MLNALAIVLEEPGRLSLRRLPLDSPGAADVVVATLWSGVSTGTGMMKRTGLVGKLRASCASRGADQQPNSAMAQHLSQRMVMFFFLRTRLLLLRGGWRERSSAAIQPATEIAAVC